MIVEIHDDYFASDALDETWLSEIGKRGWVAITKDERIRYRKIDQSRLTKRMKLVLERAGIETAHGLYDLRHSFVTHGLVAGRSPTDIAADIGDAVETVLRFCAHPTSTHRSTETCNTDATRERKNRSHPPESNRRPADYESPLAGPRRTKRERREQEIQQIRASVLRRVQ